MDDVNVYSENLVVLESYLADTLCQVRRLITYQRYCMENNLAFSLEESIEAWDLNIFITDERDRVSQCNKYTADIHQLTPGDLIGRTYLEVAEACEVDTVPYYGFQLENQATRKYAQRRIDVPAKPFLFPDGCTRLSMCIREPMLKPGSRRVVATLGVSLTQNISAGKVMNDKIQ